MTGATDIKFVIERSGLASGQVLEGLHAAAFHRPGDETWTERSFSDVLNSPGSFCLLAVEDQSVDSAPCGFSACRVRAQEAELLSLGVVPAFRRQGVAQQLIARTIETCQRIGARNLFLEVAEDNPAAQTLYERLDFEQVGTRRGYYHRLGGAQVNARTMRLVLD